MGQRWAVAVMLLGLGGTARADAPAAAVGLPGESPATGRRLAAADKLAADRQWPEAVEEYLHVLAEAGDDLVPVDARHAVAARWLCHLRLAAAPPDALRLYRERVDAQARKWWGEAEAERDVRLLRRIVDEAFCSRPTERALDLLGDLAFERGDFEEARHWWRLLVSSVEEAAKRSPLSLHFPDPTVDAARIRAKQILARAAQGRRQSLEAEVQTFAKLHPDAAGTLAGRQGKYVDTLRALALHPDAFSSPLEDPPWTTLGGAPSRNSDIPQPPGPVLVAHPAAPLGAEVPARKMPPGKVLTSAEAARRLAYYPVVAAGLVLVADAYQVTAYDLATGRMAGRYDLREDVERKPLIEPGSWRLGCRYTLTVADDFIYVRLGSPAAVRLRPAGAVADSYVVCLGLRPKDGKLIRRWVVRAADQPTGNGTAFEGSPIVHEGRLCVSRVRFTGAQVATAVECYNAATGARHWSRDVCEAREAADGEPRWHQHLLALAGPNVAYCSHSGAVIAVDAISGRVAWAVRYPSRGEGISAGKPSPRDLAPCLYADGRLFAAPADYDRVLCLDAATGQPLWESQPVEVAHLLGETERRLIVTTASRPQGIRALDTAAGRTLVDWMHPDQFTDAPSHGRGFLAGGKVFWPTRFGLCVLNAADGRFDARDHYYFGHYFGDHLGNMAFGEGCLAIAGAETLWVYLPPSQKGVRNQESGVRNQESGVRNQESGVRNQESGVRGQGSLRGLWVWGSLAAQRCKLCSGDRGVGRDAVDPHFLGLGVGVALGPVEDERPQLRPEGGGRTEG